MTTSNTPRPPYRGDPAAEGIAAARADARRQSAEEAFERNLTRVEAATKRFQELVAAHRARREQREIRWGDAGDLANAAQRLEEINAFLAGEAR